MEEATTFEFEVHIRGTLTCHKENLEKEARTRIVSKADVGSEMVRAAIVRMALPGSGPLVFEEVGPPYDITFKD